MNVTKRQLRVQICNLRIALAGMIRAGRKVDTVRGWGAILYRATKIAKQVMKDTK